MVVFGADVVVLGTDVVVDVDVDDVVDVDVVDVEEDVVDVDVEEDVDDVDVALAAAGVIEGSARAPNAHASMVPAAGCELSAPSALNVHAESVGWAK